MEDSFNPNRNNNLMVCDDSLPVDPFGVEFDKVLAFDPLDIKNNDNDIKNNDTDFDQVNLDIDVKNNNDSNFDIEATMSVMTCLIEVFGVETFAFGADEASKGIEIGDKRMYRELSFVWNSLVQIECEGVDNEAIDNGLAMCCNKFGGKMKDLMELGCEKFQNQCMKDDGGGEPADALFFALGHLGVEDLLSVEMVCKSLRDAVQNDPLLWRNINIVSNFKVTDDNLIRLTNRAQGTLHTLSIVQCLKITNRGLKYILENNLRLSKLSVRGCMGIHIGSLLHDLKLFNSVGTPGIKRLRIGGILGLSNQEFKEFKLLLGGLDENNKVIKYKPRYHRPEQLHLSVNEERDLDIDVCPRCQEVRDVYDCPSESCRVKDSSVQTCRACILCIARCIHCGCCLDDRLYEETFYLNFLCIDCMVQLSSNASATLAFYGVLLRL